jgi:hypothetical protein
LSKNLKKEGFMFKRTVAVFVLFTFLLSSVGANGAYAQALGLHQPGQMVGLTPAFTPAHLKGMVIHPNEPFKFDFIIHHGDTSLDQAGKQAEYQKLIKYFLAALAVPDNEQWVNLSPYEKDRIIPDTFGRTEMGRDLLSQDYILKQISASLTNPDTELGKKFWDEVYRKAHEQLGTTEVPTDTFNKVWIQPDKAVIYEKDNTVYVVDQHLKVMIESDYLAQSASTSNNPLPTRGHVAPLSGNEGGNVSPSTLPTPQGLNVKATQVNHLLPAQELASQVLKDIIIPVIEKEVNEGRNFAQLRQVYSGMLLAAWYKRSLKESILAKVYGNQNKVKGIDQDPKNNQAIYDQYVQAFKTGVFNMIKEDVDRYTNEVVPRKYFSGGFSLEGLQFDQAQAVAGQGERVDAEQMDVVAVQVDAAQGTAAGASDLAQSAERSQRLNSPVVLSAKSLAAKSDAEVIRRVNAALRQSAIAAFREEFPGHRRFLRGLEVPQLYDDEERDIIAMAKQGEGLVVYASVGIPSSFGRLGFSERRAMKSIRPVSDQAMSGQMRRTERLLAPVRISASDLTDRSTQAIVTLVERALRKSARQAYREEFGGRLPESAVLPEIDPFEDDELAEMAAQGKGLVVYGSVGFNEYAQQDGLTPRAPLKRVTVPSDDAMADTGEDIFEILPSKELARRLDSAANMVAYLNAALRERAQANWKRKHPGQQIPRNAIYPRVDGADRELAQRAGRAGQAVRVAGEFGFKAAPPVAEIPAKKSIEPVAPGTANDAGRDQAMKTGQGQADSPSRADAAMTTPGTRQLFAGQVPIAFDQAHALFQAMFAVLNRSQEVQGEYYRVLDLAEHAGGEAQAFVQALLAAQNLPVQFRREGNDLVVVKTEQANTLRWLYSMRQVFSFAQQVQPITIDATWDSDFFQTAFSMVLAARSQERWVIEMPVVAAVESIRGAVIRTSSDGFFIDDGVNGEKPVTWLQLEVALRTAGAVKAWKIRGARVQDLPFVLSSAVFGVPGFLDINDGPQDAAMLTTIAERHAAYDEIFSSLALRQQVQIPGHGPMQAITLLNTKTMTALNNSLVHELFSDFLSRPNVQVRHDDQQMFIFYPKGFIPEMDWRLDKMLEEMQARVKERRSANFYRGEIVLAPYGNNLVSFTPRQIRQIRIVDGFGRVVYDKEWVRKDNKIESIESGLALNLGDRVNLFGGKVFLSLSENPWGLKLENSSAHYFSVDTAPDLRVLEAGSATVSRYVLAAFPQAVVSPGAALIVGDVQLMRGRNLLVSLDDGRDAKLIGFSNDGGFQARQVDSGSWHIELTQTKDQVLVVNQPGSNRIRVVQFPIRRGADAAMMLISTEQRLALRQAMIASGLEVVDHDFVTPQGTRKVKALVVLKGRWNTFENATVFQQTFGKEYREKWGMLTASTEQGLLFFFNPDKIIPVWGGKESGILSRVIAGHLRSPIFYRGEITLFESEAPFAHGFEMAPGETRTVFLMDGNGKLVETWTLKEQDGTLLWNDAEVSRGGVVTEQGIRISFGGARGNRVGFKNESKWMYSVDGVFNPYAMAPRGTLWPQDVLFLSRADVESSGGYLVFSLPGGVEKTIHEVSQAFLDEVAMGGIHEEDIHLAGEDSIALTYTSAGVYITNHNPEQAIDIVQLSDRPDAAMVDIKNVYGGIDMNAASLDMQIKRDGSGVPLPVAQQDLDRIKIDGLVPVILDIRPAAALPIFSN